MGKNSNLQEIRIIECQIIENLLYLQWSFQSSHWKSIAKSIATHRNNELKYHFNHLKYVFIWNSSVLEFQHRWFWYDTIDCPLRALLNIRGLMKFPFSDYTYILPSLLWNEIIHQCHMLYVTRPVDAWRMLYQASHFVTALNCKYRSNRKGIWDS